MSERVVQVPGDKSITHRALILGALATGTTTIEQPLLSDDIRSTVRVLRALGVEVREVGAGDGFEIIGTGGRLRDPATPLDCGNSGTTARLMLGVLAGGGVRAVVTGDESLQRRPVRRVTDPLTRMGARFVSRAEDAFPVEVIGGTLHATTYASPLASAQVKSAILLAGLVGGVDVAVTEPGRSRDHTERLLSALGQPIEWEPGRVTLGRSRPMGGFRHVIPGDPSSAAFLAGAAVLSGVAIRIRGVGINPTRMGFVSVLRRMGVEIDVVGTHEHMGEPVGDLQVRPSDLGGVTVPPTEVPALIDEIPLLAIVAARAQGISRFEGVGELRVKESDRLELLRANLDRLGVGSAVDGDVLIVCGVGSSPIAGPVDTGGDHRLAMAFGVLGRVPGCRITLSEADSPNISFPGFDRSLSVVSSP